MAILGGVLAFASALGLACSREDSNEVSAWQWGDFFLLAGLCSFILGLAKGISDAFRDRSSSSFLLAVVFMVSFLVAALGIWLMF